MTKFPELFWIRHRSLFGTLCITKFFHLDYLTWLWTYSQFLYNLGELVDRSEVPICRTPVNILWAKSQSATTATKTPNKKGKQRKGPVKLFQRVKKSPFNFAISVKSVPLYHFKLSYVVLHMAVRELFETHFWKRQNRPVLIFRVIFDQPWKKVVVHHWIRIQGFKRFIFLFQLRLEQLKICHVFISSSKF